MTILRGAAHLGAWTANAAWSVWRSYRSLPPAQSRAFLRRTARAAAAGLARFEVDVHAAVIDVAGIGHPVMRRLGDEARGLHALLPDHGYGYSILLAIDDEHPGALATTLEACRDLSPSRLEILVAAADPLSSNDAAVLARFETAGLIIRRLCAGDKRQLWPALIQAATQPRLLLVAPGDWLRPDLLYRYELILRSHPESPRVVLSCASRRLDPSGALQEPVGVVTSEQPHFPLAFCTDALRSGLLLPREGARVAVARGHSESALDVALGTIAGDAPFLHVPIPLRAEPARQDDVRQRASALSRYFAATRIDWRVDDAGRIRPWPLGGSALQVIVLYRDEGERTLASVASVRAQCYPDTTITAVDNASQDRSIAARLSAEGTEVVRVDEAFNYSRLNNLAARRSASDLLLFLNNDIILRTGALAELVAWAIQKPVGIVGPALFFPDGRLQHGGIEIDPVAPADECGWEVVDRARAEPSLDRAKRQRVVDAVTGACLMTRREVFEEVQGFDEINYPVAFSDTDLALRVRKLGLKCMYTPYAEGVHDESASRRYPRLENFEGSSWFAGRLGREPLRRT